ncbi:MAG: tetratricopeptide repeat protein [Rhodopirellula sp. JB053]
MPSTESPIFSVVAAIALTLMGAWLSNGSAGEKETSAHVKRHADNIASAKQFVRAQGDSPSSAALTRLGDAMLRGGRCEEAVTHFELAIKQSPQSLPYLWQYGIALYFVERYDDARMLFEKHRLVNSNDVENAAWHFLCVAKASNLSQARSILLPAPGDTRVPMEAVLQRLPGGDFSAIRLAITETENTPQHQDAKFYGDLYMGLISDAEGDRKAAVAHLNRAAATPMTHYMADIARVYAEHLSAQD